VKDIQTVLFDLDGTIIDARDRLLASCRRALRELAVEIPDEADCWQAFRTLDAGRLVPAPLRERFYELLMREYMAYTGEIRLIPGAHETLEYCRAHGYRTGIITGRPSSPDRVRAELDRLGVLPFIEVIKTQAGTPLNDILSKEQQLLEAVAELRAKPEQSLYVGDLPNDIVSGRRAGLRACIAVLSGGVDRELLVACQPDALLNSIGELPEYLRDP